MQPVGRRDYDFVRPRLLQALLQIGEPGHIQSGRLLSSLGRGVDDRGEARLRLGDDALDVGLADPARPRDGNPNCWTRGQAFGSSQRAIASSART